MQEIRVDNRREGTSVGPGIISYKNIVLNSHFEILFIFYYCICLDCIYLTLM